MVGSVDPNLTADSQIILQRGLPFCPSLLRSSGVLTWMPHSRAAVIFSPTGHHFHSRVSSPGDLPLPRGTWHPLEGVTPEPWAAVRETQIILQISPEKSCLGAHSNSCQSYSRQKQLTWPSGLLGLYLPRSLSGATLQLIRHHSI